jgi:uncharacterized protein
MGRLLVLLALAAIAVWLVKRALRGDAAQPPKQKRALEGELVSCARCGLHLPRGEAREEQGQLYCSEEHARLGRGPGA